MTTLHITGYETFEALLSPQCCNELSDALPILASSGSRMLLSHHRIQNAIRDFRSNSQLQTYISELIVVQCTLFRKSQDHNWSVQLHRDVVVPLQGTGPWKSAGLKEGYECVKPPRAFLDRCVALRVHLDGAPEGDLEVVPGSHRDEREYHRSEAISIPIAQGGGLLMRPTLAHASSKLKNSKCRRVLHYLFAPPDLPGNYRWYHAV